MHHGFLPGGLVIGRAGLCSRQTPSSGGGGGTRWKRGDDDAGAVASGNALVGRSRREGEPRGPAVLQRLPGGLVAGRAKARVKVPSRAAGPNDEMSAAAGRVSTGCALQPGAPICSDTGLGCHGGRIDFVCFTVPPKALREASGRGLRLVLRGSGFAKMPIGCTSRPKRSIMSSNSLLNSPEAGGGQQHVASPRAQKFYTDSPRELVCEEMLYSLLQLSGSSRASTIECATPSVSGSRLSWWCTSSPEVWSGRYVTVVAAPLRA